MRLTVKEMEILCIFHAGTRHATLEALRKGVEAVTKSGAKQYRADDVQNLMAKLSDMRDGDIAFITFESEK